MNTNFKPSCVTGMEEIASLYDAFLIDQWGVIHNGKSLYDGALETLKKLRESHKTVIIITNSSKTKDFNIKRLNEKFGIPPRLYSEIISSAEFLRELLVKKLDHPWSSFGTKIFIIADGQDADFMKGTSFETVSDIREADVVMLLSIGENENKDNHQEWITQAIKKQLFLVCPSADQLSVSPNGVFQGMGSIVSDYKEKGGTVINVGKPETIIYEYSSRFFSRIQLHRILAIGDQIASDVYGAKRYGIHAALVATGATKLSFPLTNSLEDIADAAFSASYPKSISPDWILPSLKWKKE